MIARYIAGEVERREQARRASDEGLVRLCFHAFQLRVVSAPAGLRCNDAAGDIDLSGPQQSQGASRLPFAIGASLRGRIGRRTRAQTPALLKGLIFGPTGAAMSPTHTRKGNRLYRYYVSQDVLKRGPEACPVGRVPAAEIEAAVIDQLRGIFRQPEIIVGTWRAARAEQDDITEDEAREALLQLDPLWDELFPAEQARIVQLLVERVDVRMHGVEVRLRPNGLAGLVREVAGSRRAAA